MGLEPGAVGLNAKITPLSYGDPFKVSIFLLSFHFPHPHLPYAAL